MLYLIFWYSMLIVLPIFILLMCLLVLQSTIDVECTKINKDHQKDKYYKDVYELKLKVSMILFLWIIFKKKLFKDFIDNLIECENLYVSYLNVKNGRTSKTS